VKTIEKCEEYKGAPGKRKWFAKDSSGK